MRSRVIGAPLSTIVVGPSAAIQPLTDQTDVYVVKGNGASPVLLSLPSNPNDGDSFAVEDGAGNAGSEAITVFSLSGTVPGAQPIIGPVPGQAVINTNFGGLQFTFSTFAGGWLVAQYQGGGPGLLGSNRSYGNKGTFPAGNNVVMMAVARAQGSGVFRASATVAWHAATAGDTLSWTLQSQNGTGPIAFSNATQFGPTTSQAPGGGLLSGAGAFVAASAAGIAFVSGGGNSLNQDQKQQDIVTGIANGEYAWSGVLSATNDVAIETPFSLGSNVWLTLLFTAAHFATMNFNNCSISLEEV